VAQNGFLWVDGYVCGFVEQRRVCSDSDSISEEEHDFGALMQELRLRGRLRDK
jgi:hypothetical protein